MERRIAQRDSPRQMSERMPLETQGSPCRCGQPDPPPPPPQVALIFRDASIGNRIDIAVVEVLRPERQSFVPKRSYENNAESMGKSAEEMLKMFCKWQKQGLKYNTNHPRRYDTALLLTR